MRQAARLSSRFLLITLALMLLFATSALSEENYRFMRMWPTLQQPWYFYYPQRIAIDKNDNVYIADTANNRIQKFTSDGNFIKKWGSKGIGDSLFINPQGIAVDAGGYVYVVDNGNSCIKKYTSDGNFVKKWGSKGTGDSQLTFRLPSVDGTNDPLYSSDISVDAEGNILVVDTGNNRIQKFTSDGDFINKWGSQGSGVGQFNMPTGIAIDSNNNVYVTDTGNNRIQKFTSDFSLIKQWGSSGSGDGQFNDPEGVVIDAEGNVYISDRLNYRIQKFTSDGHFIKSWGKIGFADGEFVHPLGMAFNSKGKMYVVTQCSDRIQIFSTEGIFIAKWLSQGDDNGLFRHCNRIATDNEGSIYAADLNGIIQKFSSDGHFIKKWVINYTQTPFVDTGIGGIAFDAIGNMYVTERKFNGIQKFDSDGNFVTKWGSGGDGDGQFNQIRSISIDTAGNLYIIDSGNNRIQKFTSDGNFIKKWGSSGSGDGQFKNPQGITIDHDGNIYVADYENNRIQQFTSDGNFIKKWGSFGYVDGKFYGPIDITTDTDGNIYIADIGNNRVQKFTPDGQFIAKIGELGSAPGQMVLPQGVSVDKNANVYIADTGNSRIQIFKKKLSTDTKAKAIIVAGGGGYAGNDLWDATKMSANFAYRTLMYQGFTKGNIRYLTSDNIDLDDNGLLDDIAGDATNANLQSALTTWAAGVDNVVVYLVDHGGVDSFRMSGNETLSASLLSNWLDILQNSITGKVIVIYDACHSGSFLFDIKPPSGKQRIVITSTLPDESAYFLTQGSVSFSNYFWNHIFNGLNIKEAFDLTQSALQYTTDKQHPQLDDNGTGIGNEAGDGSLAQTTYIGNGTVIQGNAPVITSVSSPQMVNGTNAVLLYASGVTDTDGIARVWAVIRPPDYHQGDSHSPVQSLPSIDLMPMGDNRYEATYNGFTATGTYQIAIYARDQIGNTSVPKVTQVSVTNPLSRKAIVIAGGTQTDTLWPAIEKNAGYAYDALKFQGYVDEDITFMSPVTFSQGLDGTPTLSNIQYAITTWAAMKTQDLVLYLVGNGGSGTFQVNATETLTAADLKQWLDTLQESMTGKVTVIYDAPQSGSFLPLLAPPSGKQRILISSAGNAQPANFLSSGDISFSRFFWSRVSNGMNIRDAYLQGKRALSFLSGNQIPFLDDNGNGIGNEKADGQIALNYTIGFGIILGADDPLIESVSPSQTLTDLPSALIWANNVTTTATIAKVWAVITPPGAGQSPAVPLTDLPTIELLYNTISNRYEGTYYHFNNQGDYSIAVFAVDEEGNISLPSATIVTQTVTFDPYEDDNRPAHASIIVLNDTLPQTHNFHAPGDEDWVKFHAIADEIYEVKASNLGIHADVVLELYDGDGENLIKTVDDVGAGESELFSWKAPKKGIYYVRVRNYDSNVYGNHTNYDLKVYRPIQPDLLGTIKGIIVSDWDLARINIATIQAGLGSALSQDGSFTLRVEAGTVNVSINVKGLFTKTVENVVVEAGKEKAMTITMMPPYGDINGNGILDLTDAILAFKALTKVSIPPSVTICTEADVNGDGRIGMPEVIYIMQKAAGLR
jgi:streptogramin lyase